MASTTNGSTGVLVDAQGGITVIPAKADLTRLNYFDGRFVRADDLQAEQDYLRTLVRLSNRAGGAGIVDGFDAALSASHGSIVVKPGLAFDGDGHTLLLPVPQTLDVGKLIDAAKNAAAPSAIAGSSDFKAVAWRSAAGTPAAHVPGLYLLTVGFAEAACGQESVYGNLCADPCSGSTNARYLVEGVIFRAAPLALDLSAYAANKAIVLEAKHMRSRVASAYFAREATLVQSLISGAGLRAGTWCLGAAAMAEGDVPLAVFQWSGSAIQFLDTWTARRERMEPPPRRYWAQRMAMRPWDAYLAQILQFQCQLHELLAGGGTVMGPDPCGAVRQALTDALALFEKLGERISGLSAVKAKLLAVETKQPTAGGELVDGGIIELPPAGYLPVDNVRGEAIEPQVRRMLGKGVDLRFCVVRPDYVPHALEERQHMERISLLDGLTDTKHQPEVDILVPNGVTAQVKEAPQGREFVVKVQYDETIFNGAARSLPFAGGIEAAVALITAPKRASDSRGIHAAAQPRKYAAFAAASIDSDPFTLAAHSTANVKLLWTGADSPKDGYLIEAEGTFTIKDAPHVGSVPNSIEVQGVLKMTSAEEQKKGALSETAGHAHEWKVKLTKKTGPGPEDVSIWGQMMRDNYTVVFKLSWTQNLGTTSVTLDVNLFDKSRNMAKEVASGTALEQPNVLETANDSHQQVLEALKLIEAAEFKSVDWHKIAEAKLWPPPPESTVSNGIMAVLDWVLFCRRRACTCDVATPPPVPVPVPVPVRSFQVWAVNVPMQHWGDGSREEVLKGTENTRLNYWKVDVIDFPATGAQLQNKINAVDQWHAAFKEALKAKLVDSTKNYNIVWCGIAMNGAADDELATKRLSAYENAIEAILTVKNVPSEVLTTVPPGLAVDHTDGVIILAIIAKPPVNRGERPVIPQ